MGLPRWLRVKKKNLPANAETMSSISGSGIFPGEGNGNPLQCSCLGNLMDRGAWQGRVHGVTIVVQDLVTKPPPPTGTGLARFTPDPEVPRAGSFPGTG